jgi:glycosyltransferase involved in cell wall biosynthesis
MTARRALQAPLVVLRPVRKLATLTLAYAIFLVLIFVAHVERRRRRRNDPRIFWGADPHVDVLRPHAQALRRLGYPTAYVVAPGEIEVHGDFGRASAVPRLARPYSTFAWALRHADIFVFSPDSTILRSTPLEYRQLQLLRVARRKVLLLPHGPDVRIPSRAHDLLFKHAVSADCPSYVRAEGRRLRDLEYCSHYSDQIVSGADWVDSMPWWDRLTAGPFTVDVDEWRPEPRSRPEPERPLVVLHAPHERELAGTAFLVRACDELSREGLAIDLRIAERPPAESMRRLVEEADVVAEQFVAGWYAQLAVEGMSMEKPVLSYLRPDLLELYTLFSFAGECPIVNTPPREIKQKLRELAVDDAGRAELGRRGRRYVCDHHSLESLEAMLGEIVTALWSPQAAS